MAKNEIKTLKNFVTDNEAKFERLHLLKQLSDLNSSSRWATYLKFYSDNLSGDMDGFSLENKTYIETMVKAIDKKRAEVERGE